MASSKAHLFPQDLFEQAFWDKQFSHPARRIILRHLNDHGTTAFKVIRKLIPLATSTVSQHFRFLKNAHVLTSEDVYHTTLYTIKNRCRKIVADKLKQYNQLFPPEPPDSQPTVKNP